jgi:hypothetical protein
MPAGVPAAGLVIGLGTILLILLIAYMLGFPVVGALPADPGSAGEAAGVRS